MNYKNLESFLASHKQGEFVSHGEFQLSPGELARKLGDTLAQPQKWVLKFVQVAYALKAKRIKVKIDRRWLRIEMNLSSHFAVTTADEFLNSPPESRAHKHALLGLLCAANLFTSEEIRLLWTTDKAGLCHVSVRGRHFHLSGTPHADEYTPFLGFALKRRPMTRVEKFFGKASFLAESRMLQECCRLYPGKMLVDGRPLESWLQPRGAAHTSLVGLITGGVGDQKPLVLPRSILNQAERYPPTQERTPSDALLEILYTDPELARLPCILHWVMDGVVMTEEQLLPADTNVSFGLYLCARGLKTDLSTFQLVENQAKTQRLTSSCMKEWTSRTFQWAGSYCLGALTKPDSSLKQLFRFQAKRPVEPLSLRDGLQKRRVDLRNLLHRL